MERVARLNIPDGECRLAAIRFSRQPRGLNFALDDRRLFLCSDFEPLRVSVQGEAIRELDSGNAMANSQNRKAAHGDSDDEDGTSQSALSDRSTMDIYRQRQQKRVKLSAATGSADQATPPVLT